MSQLLWAFALLCAFVSWHASDLYYPWLKFQSEGWAAVSLLFVVAACALPSRKHSRQVGVPLDYLSWFLLALPFVACGHLLFNPEVFLGDVALVTLYAIGAFVALEQGRISAALHRSGGIEVLCLLLLVSGITSVAEALYQWLQLDGLGFWVIQLPENVRPSGNFAQANRMALHTAVGIAAAFCLNQRGILTHWATALLVSFLGLGVALTQSRAGLLSAVLILGFSVYFCRERRRSMVFYSALLVAVFSLFWALPTVSSALELGLIRTSRLAMGSRTSLMLGFIDGVLQQPWWGYGPGQIVQVQVQQAANAIPVLVSFWSHNIALDMALLFGVPVAIIFVLLIGYFAIRLIKNSWIQDNQFVVLAVIPFAVACNTEYPHAYLNSLLLFMYIMGFASFKLMEQGSDLQSEGHGTGELKAGIKKIVTSLVVLSFFALGSIVVVDYYRLAYSLQVARFEAARAGTFPPGYSYPQSLLLTNLQALIFMVRQNDFATMNSKEIEEYRNAAFRNPYEPALRGYAVASGLHGVAEGSKYSADSALKILESFYGKHAKDVALRRIELLRKEIQESGGVE